MKRLNLLFVFVIMISGQIMSQSYVQVIKGRVLDKVTQIPLPGANVLVLGTEPLQGTTTDPDGYFHLPDVKVGRVSIQVSYMGYHSQTLNSVLLHSGKELVLNIQLEEKVMSADEVVIVYQRDKTKPINEMTTVSARTFSVEESDKYAGTFGDVARMASNYAGVQGIDDSSNDIIIRGNSPLGLLWRLEGVDIPNPNHYGQFGATGGPVSMLNNNVLANSDFLTGAYPAEYGNAFSGAFDLQMRNGNYDQHEFLGMIGMGGFELGAEGPISKKNHSSYIINYRYSVLSLMSMIMDLGTGTGVPEYQDLTFKFNLPTRRFGTFSIFGLGGLSNIEFLTSESDEETDDSYYDWADFDYDAINKNKVGVVGLNHKFIVNETSYTRFNIAATFQENINGTDSLSTIDGSPFNWYRQDFIDQKFNMSFTYHKKINVKNNFKIGVRASQTNMSLTDSIYENALGRYEVTSDYDGTTYLVQPFIHWQFKPLDYLVFNAGINVPYMSVNNEYLIEPRAGVKWNVNQNHALSFAYGLHSKTPNLAVVFRQVEENGEITTPNTDLGFTKSHHFVLGYDWNINSATRLKLETYYQKIYDAPIDQTPSPYSGLNDGSFTSEMSEYIMNGGDGENIGLELTMERFLHKGLYYLFTASIFDSKYIGSDGVERNTAFNSNYICNALVGKEWQFGKKDNKFFGINTKFVTAGGKLYTPIDLEASQAQQTTIYNDDLAFSERMKDFVRLDIQLSFKSNSKKYTQEYALDIKNVTNYQNPFMMRYNVQTGELVTIYQAGFSPMLTYRIIF